MTFPVRAHFRGIIGLGLLLCSLLLPWGLELLLESTLAEAARHNSPSYTRSVGAVEFSLWRRELTLHDVSIHALREEKTLSAARFSGVLTWDTLWLALGITEPTYDAHLPVLKHAELENFTLLSPSGELYAEHIDTDAFGIWKDFFAIPEDRPLGVSNRIWWHITLGSLRMTGLRWHDTRLTGRQELAAASVRLQLWDNRTIDSVVMTDISLAPRAESTASSRQLPAPAAQASTPPSASASPANPAANAEASAPGARMASLTLEDIHLPGESLLTQLDKSGPAFSEAWITTLFNGLLQGQRPFFEQASARDIQYTDDTWSVQECAVAWPASAPQRLRISLGGASLSASVLENMSGLRFPALHSITVLASFSSHAEKDGSTRQRLTLACPKLADFTLETTYENPAAPAAPATSAATAVPAAPATSAAPAPAAPAVPPRISAFTFIWQDHGLAAYLVGNLGGTQASITEHLQRMQLGRRSQRDVRLALQNFLEHSGTLTCTLADGKPVTLDAFLTLRENPADILDVAVQTGKEDVLRTARDLFSK